MSAVIECDSQNPGSAGSVAQMRNTGLARIVEIGRSALLDRFYWAGPTLLAFAVTAVGVTRPSLWADELATWSAARRSWSQLWTLLGDLDAVAAPYYVFMHVWMRIFGESELALRAPSIIAMTATAGLLVVLGRRLYSIKVGVIAGVLFAIMPMITRFAQEARVASFVVLFAVLSTLALTGAVDRSRWWRWGGYGTAVLALGAANLIALMLLAAHAVFVAKQWWESRSNRSVALPARWLASVIVPLLLLSPMIYFGHQQSYQLSWIEQPSWAVFNTLPALTGSAALGGALIALGLLGLLALPLAGRAQSMLVAWLALPPVLLFAVSVLGSQSYWVRRYLIFLLPGLALLAALGLSKTKLGYCTLVIAALAVFIFPVHLSFRDPEAHYGFNGPVVERYVSQRLAAGDVAVFPDADSHGSRNLIRYYGPSSTELPDALAIRSGEEIGRYGPAECGQPAACLADVQRIWLFRWSPFGDDPFGSMNNPVKEAFLRDNFTVAEAKTIGQINVLLLQRK